MEMTESVDPDLSTLDDLTEQTILKRLKSRYERDLIYTCVKDILIAINPCKQLISIYDEKNHEDYGSEKFDVDLQPHVFQVAAWAYRRLCDSETNQVIIVSGESGSGKTESAKYMVRHIVHMCKNGQGQEGLYKKIVAINPLLESFGNAKTTMNPNSSRFAKYLELTFNQEGLGLAGAVVRDYMLEKSRVIRQSPGEGNFHIFYALFAGCSTQKLEDLFLIQSPGSYRIMRSDTKSLADRDRYKNMYDSNMQLLGNIGVDTEILHVILAAIVLVSEIDFEEGDQGSANIVNPAPLEHAAKLLELDEKEFEIALTTSKRTFQGQDIVSHKTMNQARASRDALAKMLYERMFGWLVRQINQDLHPNRQSSVKDSLGSIGILDIAGFENLRTNSLEQMCINLVNEKLQSFMNEKIFQIEMYLYQEEGINIDGVHFEKNDLTLAMFEEKKVGILAILDEKSLYQQGNDDGFVNVLKEKLKSNPLFTEVKSSDPRFFIQHFAAQVCYDADGFIEKNRDVLNPELTECMKGSHDDMVSDLFTVKRGPTGTISRPQNNFRKSNRKDPHVMPRGNVQLKKTPRGSELKMELGKSLKHKFGNIHPAKEGTIAPITQVKQVKEHKTLVSYFRASLLDLIDKLNSAEPFYVRCLKPNMSLQPKSFEDTVVINQLHYNGITQIAKIRKMGYAVRIEYQQFVKKFKTLYRGYKTTDKYADTTRTILHQLPAGYHRDFRMGKTKVFLTNDVNQFLGKFLTIREKAERRISLRLVPYMQRKICAIREKKRQEEEEKKQRKIEEETKIPSGIGKSLKKSVRFPDPVEDYDDVGTSGNNEPQPGPSGITRDNPLGDTVKIPEDQNVKRPPSPVSKIDPDRDTHANKDKKENREKSKKENAKKFFWDLCRIIVREQREKDVHEYTSLQVIKVITYFLLFCILLWCAIAQKISLMVLASPQYSRTGSRAQSKSDQDSVIAAGRHMLMTLAILIPYGLMFLSSMFKWIFGNCSVPGAATFLWLFFLEFLHSAGLCILCFLLLPEVDMARGIMLMSGVAIAPAILNPLCSSRANKNDKPTKPTKPTKPMKVVQFTCGLIFILIQCGYIPLLILDEYVQEESRVDNQTGEVALVVVCMICISVSWWENFVDDSFCGATYKNGGWHQFILSVKFDLQKSRPVASFFMSMWKIVLTILFSWVSKTYLTINEEDALRDINNVTMDQIYEAWDKLTLKDNSAILTLTVASFAGYYVAYTACKLRLQKFSFNIPLLLSLPLSVIIVCLDCSGDFNLLSPFTNEERACTYIGQDEVQQHKWYHFLFGAAAWISLYGIARHIFYPSIERMAKIERLFINPYYCGILFEQHMIMNRRRHNRKVIREFKEKKMYYRLSDFDSKVTIEGEEEENKDGAEHDIESDEYRNPKFRDVPTIYACATMWHENKREMVQLMKSIFRMDRDQSIRRTSEAVFGKEDKEYYEFEAHVFFDDAMELNDNNEMVPNEYVKDLISIMDEAASSVFESHFLLKAPYKIFTPYGGQLVWMMPGNNFFFVHLKDKLKVRHKKRWSQVMYMYYLLGFRIVRMCQEAVTSALNEDKLNDLGGWEKSVERGEHIGKSHIFQAFDEQVIRKANNTFLLALDGDVDFSPGAVRLLLDRMRKSELVGAACGRIHPIGSGPVVWFQKFEYAIAHWLQKATEHVLGCVLCSPGCFSLFRGSALMDDNVMRKYTVLPQEAHHHLMYDQGEDRWLCTLLLQQGYRVDYAAGADAFTYAPEGFVEFFNQRRRWMPSTIANIVDLLANYKNTVYINNNISMLYIFYQASLLVSTLIGPATILMMIAGANLVIFKVNLFYSYLIALAPAIIFFVLCFVAKTKHQILAAEILTIFYAFTMMIVLVGTIVSAADEGVWHPSVIFIACLVFLFGFAALLHPKEWTCLIFGALYFILIPTGFLLLTFYSLCNMHVISWGTREVPKRKSAEEIKKENEAVEEKKRKKKEQGFFGRFFPSSPVKDIKEHISKITDMQGSRKPEENSESVKILQEINASIQKLGEQIKEQLKQETVNEIGKDEADQEDDSNKQEPVKQGILKKGKKSSKQSADKKRDSVQVMNEDADELKNPSWAEIDELKNAPSLPLMEAELNFWQEFIKKYLYPLEKDEKEQAKTLKDLKGLRNNVCLGMAMVNMLWIAINFMLQLNSQTKIKLKISSNPDDKLADNIVTVDGLGLLFIIFYVVILFIQFFGMLMHRWGTFLHLVAVTELKNPFQKKTSKDPKQIDSEEARKIVKDISEEPLPEYPDSESDGDEEDENQTIEELKQIQTTGTRNQLGFSTNGGIGISTRLFDASRQDGVSQDHRNTLAQSMRLFQLGIQASGKFTQVPNKYNCRAKMQEKHRRGKDSRYNNKAQPLPTVQKRQRLNLNMNAGRIDLTEKLKNGNHGKYFEDDQSKRPFIEENTIYDTVYGQMKPKGTLNRQFAKNLKLYASVTSDSPEDGSHARRRPESARNRNSLEGERL